MRHLVALLLLSSLVAACDSNEGDPAPPGEPGPVVSGAPLIPLTVGNFWVYRTVEHRYGPDGTTIVDVDTLARRDTLMIADTFVINGETWYQTRGTGLFRISFPKLLVNREDGLYGRGFGSGDNAFKVAAYPAAIGTRFGRSGYNDATGPQFDSDVTLKRVDLPVPVGPQLFEGHLYTVNVRRFTIGAREYPVDSRADPDREVIVPGVGYAQYESGYYTLAEGVFRRGSRTRYTLESFAQVVVD